MKTVTGKKEKAEEAREGAASTYDEFKEFEGKKYTGMNVGRHHKWLYDEGEWKETKVTPDTWEFNYAVTKRRAGKAPEGSGVPVGTEYHWYIAAHQNVKKLNANDYEREAISRNQKFLLSPRRPQRLKIYFPFKQYSKPSE